MKIIPTLQDDDSPSDSMEEIYLMKTYSFYLGSCQQFKYTRRAKDENELMKIIKEHVYLPNARHNLIPNEQGLPKKMKSLKVSGYPSIILFTEA